MVQERTAIPEGQRQRRPLTQIRLRGAPVHIPSKNFLAHHQLDVHFWTEFLYTWCRQYGPSRHVCSKRADTLLKMAVSASQCLGLQSDLIP